MFSVRVYVLAMCTRVLLLIQLLMVLALLAKYCVDVREYPRSMAGWILAPATLTMAVSTFLTTYFHRRWLRHFWLLGGRCRLRRPAYGGWAPWTALRAKGRSP